MSLKRRASGGLFGDIDPDWTAAVEQLAWEKDLDLSASAGGAAIQISRPAPLDHVNSPPASTEHKLSEAPTETSTVGFLRLFGYVLKLVMLV